MIIYSLYLILCIVVVRHSTTLIYPPIENSFNGCQGHPLVCLPPGIAQRQGNLEVKRLNAQQFIQLTLVDSCRWHKMRKAVEAWKQKRSAYYDMYIMILFTHYGIYFWLELAHAFPHFKTYTNYMRQSACFSFDFRLAIAIWTVVRHTVHQFQLKINKIK